MRREEEESVARNKKCRVVADQRETLAPRMAERGVTFMLIAVESQVNLRPPQRSERAQLRRSNPTLNSWRRRVHLARDEGYAVAEDRHHPTEPSAPM